MNTLQPAFYLLHSAQDGKYYFRLYDGDQILLTGGGYRQKLVCEAIIRRVQRWCLFNTQYQRIRYKNTYVFSLYDEHGTLLGSSLPTLTQSEMEVLVQRVKEVAWQAPCRDFTVVSA